MYTRTHVHIFAAPAKPVVGGGSFLAQLLKGSSSSKLTDVQLAAQANTFTLAELSHRVHAFMLHSCGRNGMLLLNGYSSLQRVSLTTVVGMLTVKEGLPGLCQKESSLPRLPHL
eukprot:scaffold178624_cov19-Tisochrysis_lutea.AAC.1